MRLLIAALCTLFACVWLAPHARAQTMTTPEELPRSQAFVAYLRGTIHSKVVIDTIAAMDSRSGQTCAEPHQIRVIALGLVRPVAIGPNSPTPNGGAWTEKISAQRCGRSSVVNIMFVAGEGPVPRPVELLPGMTSASPQLMRDVLTLAISGAVLVASKQQPAAKDCKQTRIIDTSAPTVTGDKRAEPGSIIGQTWFETWTFDVCGTPAVVKINFSENLRTKGTNFAISAN